MRRDQLAYLLFVVTDFAQFGVLEAIHGIRTSKGAVVVLVLLVAWLGRRSRTAWWLFVIGNGWLVLGSLPLLISSGGHILWGDTIAVGLGSSVLLAILLSAPMRRWSRPGASAGIMPGSVTG